VEPQISYPVTLAPGWSYALVCHADAGDWRVEDGPDDFRPLSPLGWLQAADVIDVLRPIRPRWLLSSPSLRCRQTLVPTAEALGLDIEANAGLMLRGNRDPMMRLISSPDADGVVLCSQKSVIDEILDRLPAAAVLRQAGLPRPLALVVGVAGEWPAERDITRRG
jgi:phosphohistidine phosphatase SixA